MEYHFIYLLKEKQDIDENPNDKILIIDGLNTFIRVFSIYPTQNDDGIHIGGIVGFLKSLGHAIRTISPTRCIIVFDGKGGSSRRRKMFPGYKNNRKPTIQRNQHHRELEASHKQLCFRQCSDNTRRLSV